MIFCRPRNESGDGGIDILAKSSTEEIYTL